MNREEHLRILVVGDDAAERRRVMSWFRAPVLAEDGGEPAPAIDRATAWPYDAVVYTASTDSVDLATWQQALNLSGFLGAVLDSRPRGRLPDGVLRVAGLEDVRHALGA
jgi:hypothetical protein